MDPGMLDIGRITRRMAKERLSIKMVQCMKEIELLENFKEKVFLHFQTV